MSRTVFHGNFSEAQIAEIVGAQEQRDRGARALRKDIAKAVGCGEFDEQEHMQRHSNVVKLSQV